MSLLLLVLLLLIEYHVLEYMKQFRIFMKMLNPLMKIIKDLRLKIAQKGQSCFNDLLEKDTDMWDKEFREPLLEDFSD